MTRQDALRRLEVNLELRPNTLTGGETLKGLEGWDSLSTMAFIAMVDKELGQPLSGNQVARCQTVNDLLALLGLSSADQAA
jgi:acyl carrier protein